MKSWILKLQRILEILLELSYFSEGKIVLEDVLTSARQDLRFNSNQSSPNFNFELKFGELGI
jgi:hypothetical protein